MLVLAIDTAGQTGGVLLARIANAGPDLGEPEVLGMRALEPRKFSIQLISAISELMRLNRAALADLDAIAVIAGPGSFTGLRAGVSAVKAIAEVTAKPILSLSRLAIMASAAEVIGCESSADRVVHAVLDAGRGEFYHGIYREAGRICVAESLDSVNALLDSFQQFPGLIVTSEAPVFDALQAANLQPCPIQELTVHEALPLIASAWQVRRFTEIARLDANYLRRADPVSRTKIGRVPEPDRTQAGRP